MEFFKKLTFFRPQSNKSSIGPAAAIFKGDLDDSYIKDPRLKLDHTLDQCKCI